MTDSLLATKLYIPTTRPKIVSRPPLIERLNQGLYRKLTLLSAPAGFGKTTLVAEWLDNLRLDAKNRIAWLSLDEGDNDLARFLSYFITALKRIDGFDAAFGERALSMLQSHQLPPTEAVMTTLLNEIAEIPNRIILILDDYHVIDAKSVDNSLTFLLKHLSPQIHLVLATREDPQLPLSRLRSLDQLTELRADDLRFKSSEAAEFLNQVMGLNLSEEDITALETRTEGWIVGLQLAAISLQGRDNTARFIESFTGSHRLVFDYLIEEVMKQQTESVQTFLLQTAVLDRLTGSLCDALTGHDNGQETLEMLELKNLFIVPLDGQRQWYRYHHLFADLLLQRLNQTQPAQLTSLQRKASKWYEVNGITEKAIEYALQGEDFEHAADLIELGVRVLRTPSLESTWLSWVQALPGELARARPVLSVYYALSLLPQDLDAAEARLQDAERWLTADISELPEASSAEMVVANEEEFRSLPATISVARAYHAGALGDVPSVVKYAQQALDLLPEGDHLWRGGAAALLGFAYWSSGESLYHGEQRTCMYC
jgi:LuxR family maltose regulon positive regulatory protein